MMFSISPSQQERSGEPLCRPGCQIHSLPELAEPLGKLESAWRFKNRIRPFAKRRLCYVQNALRTVLHSISGKKENPMKRNEELQPGDIVVILPREEIRQTLNQRNKLKGCTFMEEMWGYCDTKQRILKRVSTFFDERDYKMKKCKGLVILDGVLCSGTYFGTCDRSCFFFWREEWLKKVDSERP
jgi:hypothetical protein